MRCLPRPVVFLRLVFQCGLLSLVVWTMPLPSSSDVAVALPQSATNLLEAPIASALGFGATDKADALEKMSAASVVYLSETHSEAAPHAAQLDIIRSLDARNEIVVALEMFQRPFQSVLDAYLIGELTEAELIAQSEYEMRWGFDWEFYAPILRYARDNQIPLVALNTPAETTRQVAEEGLESLSDKDFQFIPPIDEIDTSDQEYRALMRAVYSAHGGQGNSSGFENFFAAQVLWDETMADGVVQQLLAEPDRQVVVLVGEAHVGYGYGIPKRVRRRLPEVAQVSVQFLGVDETADEAFADLFWTVEAQ
ncbi:MAG: ChaN family lipoprotein [Phormidesmis sp.]